MIVIVIYVVEMVAVCLANSARLSRRVLPAPLVKRQASNRHLPSPLVKHQASNRHLPAPLVKRQASN